MADDTQTIFLGEYIFRRLVSLGIEHVFGVPGDFNLHLLDQIYNVPELKWQGCCNELNAACAADGYARIKGTPAALITYLKKSRLVFEILLINPYFLWEWVQKCYSF